VVRLGPAGAQRGGKVGRAQTADERLAGHGGDGGHLRQQEVFLEAPVRVACPPRGADQHPVGQRQPVQDEEDHAIHLALAALVGDVVGHVVDVVGCGQPLAAQRGVPPAQPLQESTIQLVLEPVAGFPLGRVQAEVGVVPQRGEFGPGPGEGLPPLPARVYQGLP